MNYIYVALVGWKHRPYFKHIVQPRLKKYANKVGAEIIYIRKCSFPHVTNVIFDAFDHSMSKSPRDQFLWLDNDILVSPQAVNVFDLPDKLFFAEPNVKYQPWWDIFKQAGVPNKNPCPCTGMVKWSQKHIEGVYEYAQQIGGEHAKDDPISHTDMVMMPKIIYDLNLAWAYFPDELHHVWKRTQRHKEGVSFYHTGGKKKKKKRLKLLLRRGGFHIDDY